MKRRMEESGMRRKLRGLLMPCGVLVLLASQAAAEQAQQPQGYGPGPWYGDGYGYGWPFWWMCPLMMLFMLGVIAVVILMRRRASGGDWAPPWQSSSDAALRILGERFARGEIHKEEYEERKAAILSGR
jgi:putative membrane protein